MTQPKRKSWQRADTASEVNAALESAAQSPLSPADSKNPSAVGKDSAFVGAPAPGNGQGAKLFTRLPLYTGRLDQIGTIEFESVGSGLVILKGEWPAVAAFTPDVLDQDGEEIAILAESISLRVANAKAVYWANGRTEAGTIVANLRTWSIDTEWRPGDQPTRSWLQLQAVRPGKVVKGRPSSVELVDEHGVVHETFDTDVALLARQCVEAKRRVDIAAHVDHGRSVIDELVAEPEATS